MRPDAWEALVAAKVTSVTVASTAELNQAVAHYIEKGYVMQSHTADMATLEFRVRFNLLLAGVLLLACIVPGLVYILSVGAKAGQQVVIRVDPAAAAGQAGQAAEAASGLTWSDDRRFWWSGSEWVDAELTVPPAATFSEDKRFWWDGAAWRPVATEPMAD